MTYIAVDIGGTNIRVTSASSLDRPQLAMPLRRRNESDYEKNLSFIIESARTLAKGEPILAVGVAMPGTLNEDKTRLQSARYLAQWIGQSFVPSLAQALNCPVYIENDGVVAGIGEALYGGTPKEFYYVIWGTGIGGASVKRSDDSAVVEVSKLPHASHFRTWEDDCGGKELAQRYGKAPEDLTEADWRKIMLRFSSHLNHFIDVTGTPAVVFGGGLAMRHQEAILAASPTEAKVMVTSLGNDNGLYGGLGLIKQAQALKSTVNSLS